MSMKEKSANLTGLSMDDGFRQEQIKRGGRSMKLGADVIFFSAIMFTV